MPSDPLLRTVRLAWILASRRTPLDALARELNVTTRTIRRDLEVLSVAGFPVESRRSDYGDTRVWFIGHDGACPFCGSEPRRARTA